MKYFIWILLMEDFTFSSSKSTSVRELPLFGFVLLTSLLLRVLFFAWVVAGKLPCCGGFS